MIEYEKLKKLLPEDDILYFARVGSSIYLKNPNDIDYLCISKNRKQAKRIKSDLDLYNIDILILNESEYLNKIEFKKTHSWHSLFNYQLLWADILYKDKEFTLLPFDMLNKKIKQEYLKSISTLYAETLGLSTQKHMFSSAYIHYYFILEIYKRNSTVLEEGMKLTAEKLRNKEDNYIDIIDNIDQELYKLYKSFNAGNI